MLSQLVVQLLSDRDFIGAKQRAAAHWTGVYTPHQSVETFRICGQPGPGVIGPSGVVQCHFADFQRDPRDRPGAKSLPQRVDQFGISNRKSQP
jgi:hypothetical protein